MRPMAQSIRSLLDSREREVRKSISDLRLKQLLPLEKELAEIIAARKAIGALDTDQDDFSDVFESYDENDRYRLMTYKQLVFEALTGMSVPETTISHLMEFIRKNFGREISQGSLSPVLSRLRDAGELNKNGKIWSLPKDDMDDL